jgi:hypothetical protein
MKRWVIMCATLDDRDDDNFPMPLFWSNPGWDCLAIATTFTEKERNTLNLPVDGKWILLPTEILSKRGNEKNMLLDRVYQSLHLDAAQKRGFRATLSLSDLKRLNQFIDAFDGLINEASTGEDCLANAGLQQMVKQAMKVREL